MPHIPSQHPVCSENVVRGYILTLLDITQQKKETVLMEELKKVTVRASHRCTRITAEGVYARDKKSGEEVFFPADTVVVSAGMRARSALADELESHCDDFYPIGDCQRARKITDAVREGYFAALYL